MLRITLYSLALVLCSWAGASAADWGDFKGRFVYDGKAPTPSKLDVSKQPECTAHNPVDETLLVGEDGGIQGVVIYVRTKGVAVHPDYEKTAKDKLVYDNLNCRFNPHILTIRTTQTLIIKNSDMFSHNSNLQPLGDQPINPLLAAGGAVEYKFNKEQTIPQPVACNIHPWMKGYILPRSNPYAAVTDEHGNFEIKNVPTGDLEIQVWKEGVGYLEAKSGWLRGRFTQKIKAGANDLGTIKVGATALKPKS